MKKRRADSIGCYCYLRNVLRSLGRWRDALSKAIRGTIQRPGVEYHPMSAKASQGSINVVRKSCQE